MLREIIEMFRGTIESDGRRICEDACRRRPDTDPERFGILFSRDGRIVVCDVGGTAAAHDGSAPDPLDRKRRPPEGIAPERGGLQGLVDPSDIAGRSSGDPWKILAGFQ
eukprot:gene12281-biopygen6852